jgi:phosphoribosylformylglycinamidine cyclo-ligase
MKELSNISDEDMFSTFNMGVGMVVVVSPNNVQKTIQILKSNKINAYAIGEVIYKCKEK